MGFGPWAPGTWGALLAVAFFALGLHRLDVPLYVAVLVALSALGVWASGAAESYFGGHDDGRIVIDEFVGQLIALFPLVLLPGASLGTWTLPGSDPTATGGIDLWWLLVVTGFVAFRWFDIRKPGPVKWAEEKFDRGVGVMADDIVAGAMAALVVMLPAYVLVANKLNGLNGLNGSNALNGLNALPDLAPSAVQTAWERVLEFAHRGGDLVLHEQASLAGLMA